VLPRAHLLCLGKPASFHACHALLSVQYSVRGSSAARGVILLVDSHTDDTTFELDARAANAIQSVFGQGWSAQESVAFVCVALGMPYSDKEMHVSVDLHAHTASGHLGSDGLAKKVKALCDGI
jgi:hypothetical protein